MPMGRNIPPPPKKPFTTPPARSSKYAQLSVDDLMALWSNGILGTIELRSWLAQIFLEFSNVRDDDVDKYFRELAQRNVEELETVTKLEVEQDDALARTERAVGDGTQFDESGGSDLRARVEAAEAAINSGNASDRSGDEGPTTPYDSATFD
jgi:hypothetical protein